MSLGTYASGKWGGQGGGEDYVKNILRHANAKTKNKSTKGQEWEDLEHERKRFIFL